jgi:hypothetical protein
MSQQHSFKAEVCFLDPAVVPNATQALAVFGFHFEVDHSAVDPLGDTVFGVLSGETTLSEDDLSDQLLKILDPFDGDADCIEWGHAGND